MARNQVLQRVLGIDPRSRGFGFGVLEGDHLVDWGFVWIDGTSNRLCIERLRRLIERFEPSIIAVEGRRRHPRRGRRVQALLATIGTLATDHRCKVRFVGDAEVSTVLSLHGRLTRYQTGVAVCLRFPEMHPRLPRPRKPWQSEPEIIAVFSAVARGLAAIVAKR